MARGISEGTIYPPGISDSDEPLPSGSGSVSKDVTDDELFDSWHAALTRWHQNLVGGRPRQAGGDRPPQMGALVRRGVPEALRGEVWQLLAGCVDNEQMMEAYRLLCTKV